MTTARLFDFNAARERRSNRMENQKSGYVSLYRSILKKPWAKDVYLRTLWDNLLFAAQRQPYTAKFKGHLWHLNIGQLVTTPADLGLGLCDRNGKPASRDAVVRMLAVFAKEGMIAMEGEKQKGTVITILNYAEYAEKVSNLPAHTPAHTPAHDEASAGAALRGGAAQGAAHTSAQHEQEGNNKKIKDHSSENSGELSDDPPADLPALRPGAATQSPKGEKWGTAEDLRAAEWMFGKVLTVSPTAQPPAWYAWANDIRLMRTALNTTHREICEVFGWANADGFWQTNVMSPAKLRKQWQTLVAQRSQGRGDARSSGSALNFDNTDWAEGLQV